MSISSKKKESHTVHSSSGVNLPVELGSEVSRINGILGLFRNRIAFLHVVPEISSLASGEICLF